MISNILLEHSFFFSLIIILFGPNYVVFTMSTVAIDIIVDQGHRYGCQMKRLDLGINIDYACRNILLYIFEKFVVYFSEN